jgi:hypothetical protein
VVVDGSGQSGSHDRDSDGMEETIVISSIDAGRIVAGDAQVFYDAVRSKVGDWALLPRLLECITTPSADDIDGESEAGIAEYNGDSLTVSGPDVGLESEVEISRFAPTQDLSEADIALKDSILEV